MSNLVDRIHELANEIRDFPLGQCSPSDDPDKQTSYIYGFLDIVRRFIGSAKRIDHELLNREVERLDTNIQFITEAYDLKADLINVIDLIHDIEGGIDPNPVIAPKVANKLLKEILNNLISESANVLPAICENYGLCSGELDEAFKSKRNYVHARTAHLSSKKILDIANKMLGKYENRELEETIDDIQNRGGLLNIVSKFSDIKNLIEQEILQAKYSIWVAVAWFTDRDLANLLYKKAKEGINVQIIINDDKINSSISEKLQGHFETHLVPDEMKRLMHHKFCVFDLKRVIHGSYNWTNKAQYNNETISLIENRAHAEEFADQFVKIKVEIKKLT